MSSLGFIASGLPAAANTTQIGASQIGRSFSLNQFTTVTNTANSCLLPLTPVSGQSCKVRNDSTTFFPLNVFPQIGGQINSLGLNAQYIIPVGGIVEFLSIGSLTWLIASQSNAQLLEPVNITSVAATATLTPVQCGIVRVTSAAADYTIELPTLQVGLRYHIVIAVTAGTNSVTIDSGVNLIKSFICGQTTVQTCLASDIIRFDSTAIVGDYLDLYCDGSFWHGIAASNVAGAIV